MTFLPREKGSSPHDPLDPNCVEYIEGEAVAGARCAVCASREQARERARAATVREIGS